MKPSFSCIPYPRPFFIMQPLQISIQPVQYNLIEYPEYVHKTRYKNVSFFFNVQQVHKTRYKLNISFFFNVKYVHILTRYKNMSFIFNVKQVHKTRYKNMSFFFNVKQVHKTRYKNMSFFFNVQLFFLIITNILNLEMYNVHFAQIITYTLRGVIVVVI